MCKPHSSAQADLTEQIISRCHRSSISRLDKLQHNSTQSFQETNKQKKSSKRCQRLKLDLFLNGKIACLSGTLVMQRADLTPFVSLLDDDEHEWIIRTCRKASDETTEHKPKPWKQFLLDNNIPKQVIWFTINLICPCGFVSPFPSTGI